MDPTAGSADGHGFFISFEGLDGSGKSTQLRLLAEELRSKGYEVVATREPGGTAIGEAVRDLLLDPSRREMAPRAEALLYAAARAQLVHQVIRPALERGAVVLSDRYVDSSIAYQGFGRELGLDDIITLSVWATGFLFPNLTLFFDLDETLRWDRVMRQDRAKAYTAAMAEAGGDRKHGVDRELDRLESEDEDFFMRVVEGYRRLAELHAHRVRVIDASGGIEQVRALTRAAVSQELERFTS